MEPSGTGKKTPPKRTVAAQPDRRLAPERR
jgi:hypothetical protein